MKQIIGLFLTIVLANSCMKDSKLTPFIEEEIDSIVTIVADENKVLLLKVDYLTYTFEGGNEIPFYDTSTFHISSTYNEPSDFGDITLFYEEFNAPLFSGSIVWMGTGAQTYPYATDLASDFDTITQPFPIPDYVYFEPVQYSNYQSDIDNGEYEQIWNAVSHLKLIEDYRTSNPNGKIHTN